MALPERIQLEVVTPERRVLARDVDEVILPGALGSFGVLPGHHPLLAELGPGVAICRSGDRTDVLAVGGGFAEVGPGHVTVLAETCEIAAEIDRGRAERKIAELRGKLTREAPPADMEVVRLRLLKHLARLQASERVS